MASIRVAINGFGRIGRLVFRAMVQNPEYDVVLINDLSPVDLLATLLQNDSNHGRLEQTVSCDSNFIYVDERRIQFFSEQNVKNLPYTEIAVDFIVDATGVYNTVEKASEHLATGSSATVVITAPSPDVNMFVMGVNHTQYDPEQDRIVSNASCTTNCLAPMAKVLNDSFQIKEGLMTTIHAATATQVVVDSAIGRDKRASRSSFNNIIYSSTGAAKALGKVIPELEGKISGNAVRVPVTNVSVVDLTVRLERSTSLDEIAAKMKEASETYMHGIMGYTEEQLVSTDFNGCPLSSVYDRYAGIQLNPQFFKLVSWYDNEWGYANRCVDLISYMSNAK